MDITCSNCSQAIGELEEPREYGDRLVCAACHDKLSIPSRNHSPSPQATEAATQTASPPFAQQIIVNAPAQRQSQALPALVNVFLPPLGQLIQGRILACLAWFILFVVINLVVAFATAGIGLLVSLPVMWLLCILDAAWYKPK